MPLSVVDLYKEVLPKTNCRDCGWPTCLAFAGMVVSEQYPLSDCPHLDPDVHRRCQSELAAQYQAGKWTKRDLAQDALKWAKERSAATAMEALPARLGGRLIAREGQKALEIPYFNGSVVIAADRITRSDGSELNHWEQVFLYNHVAQGGVGFPTGRWKGFREFPNTVSKVKNMAAEVEAPLVHRFQGRLKELETSALNIGGCDVTGEYQSADRAILFRPLPRVPVLLMFWDVDPADGFEAEAKLLFDETIVEHLDIESVVFLSVRLRQLLCEAPELT
jgi:hypothetical protein